MNQPLLFSILAAGFTVAFFHTAIPTHWLPFALTGRAQGWSPAKTLTITGFAALGHTLFTTFLGVIVALLGMTVDRWTGEVFPWIAGGLLFAVGLFFLIRQVMGHGHAHFLHGPAHEHGPEDIIVEDHETNSHVHRTTDRAAIVGLLALLTFSPCEGFLPIYVSAVRLGWQGFLFSSLVLAIATTAGMMTFTALTMSGLHLINLKAIEKYESGILGLVLCVLAVVIVFAEG